MGNPFCPNCHGFLKKIGKTINHGFLPCPKCGNQSHKPYILTEKKKGMHRCSRCKQVFMPKRECCGYGKFWKCQKCGTSFPVGSALLPTTTPFSTDQILKNLKIERVEVALPKRRRQNVRTR